MGSAKEIEKVKNVVNYYSFSKEVHFLGFRNDTVDLLRQSEVVVVPSQHSESFGLTIVESMAQRVPVVATAVGGIPEVLENGKGGYVVPLDPNLFAEKIIFLLKDPLLRKSVGEIGYEVVQQRFTIKRMVEDYYHLTRHPA
jgi:glycosyltransferase involved in cell wall biosynthesis